MIAHQIERFEIVLGDHFAFSRGQRRVHDANVTPGDLVILPVAGLLAVSAGAVGPSGRERQFWPAAEKDLLAARRQDALRRGEGRGGDAGAEPEQVPRSSADREARNQLFQSDIGSEAQRVADLVRGCGVEIRLAWVYAVVRIEIELEYGVEADGGRRAELRLLAVRVGHRVDQSHRAEDRRRP